MATIAADYSCPAVIAPDDPAFPLLALPGLLTAAMQTPPSTLDITLHHVCALALAACTPPGLLLPDLTDCAATENVAHAVTQALHHPRLPEGHRT